MPHKNTKTGKLIKEHICTHGYSNRMLEDRISKHFRDIVSEELRHLFHINFRVLVYTCIIRIVQVSFGWLTTRYEYFRVFINPRAFWCSWFWEYLMNRNVDTSNPFNLHHISLFVVQYVWRFSFKTVDMFVRSKDRNLIEELLDPEIYLSL